MTGLLFYVNVDDESYVFQKPDLVMQEDINNVGNHIINANRPEDWRRMRLHAGMLIFLDEILFHGIFDTLFLFHGFFFTVSFSMNFFQCIFFNVYTAMFHCNVGALPTLLILRHFAKGGRLGGTTGSRNTMRVLLQHDDE